MPTEQLRRLPGVVWCAAENLRNDWSDGLYTDIDGAVACDNVRHGCGITDTFGRSGRTWPLYAHRGLSRRLYALCHDAGKRYFAHAHSNWYSLFNAFNDGWCPGEQFSTDLVGKPAYYMADLPDRTWRAEFFSPATGVATFLLPQLDRFTGPEALRERASSECCIVAAMSYGVPLWAWSLRQDVVEEVWAVQQAFGMKEVTFVPFWEQMEFTSSDPEVRVSYWRKPGRRLVVIANFTDQAREMTLQAPNEAILHPVWRAENATVAGPQVTVSIPAWNGILLTAEGLPD